MARFQHPYAVTLYDASLNDPEGPCIVMEYVRGVSLDSLLLHNNRLSPPRVGRLLGQLCEVLQAAHAEGVIHRDLKPANLMVVDPDTPYERIKVMDFGLATLLDPATLKKVTNTNTEFAVGTPGYMSPEQIRGEKLDHRSDLYSVGIILYELLTGKLPFGGKASMEILLAHATEDPPSFADMGAGDVVPEAIQELVLACLAKDPAKRPPSARELAERFEIALDHEQVMQQQTLPPEHPRSLHHEDQAEDSPIPGPYEVIHRLKAWMPETIAAYKLCGFVQDAGGEVIESVPGRIRVRLGGPRSAYRAMAAHGPLSWLGLPSRSSPIDMELRLQQADPERASLLHITVSMRPSGTLPGAEAPWRARCTQIYCDLRGYLMGQQGPEREAVG
jgi:serine/threonine-protein kinase